MALLLYSIINYQLLINVILIHQPIVELKRIKYKKKINNHRIKKSTNFYKLRQYIFFSSFQILPETTRRSVISPRSGLFHHFRTRGRPGESVNDEALLFTRCPAASRRGRNVAICLTVKLLNATAAFIAARQFFRRHGSFAPPDRATRSAGRDDASVRATGAWDTWMGWDARVSWYLGAQDAAPARTEEPYRVKSRLSICDQPA